VPADHGAQADLDELASGPSDDVANEEDAHGEGIPSLSEHAVRR
jgi:hypothetical protein